MAHPEFYIKFTDHVTFTDVVGQEQVTKPREAAKRKKKWARISLCWQSRAREDECRTHLRKCNWFAPDDLYEVDAASNNNVEDIRALTGTFYTAVLFSLQVYILDEVHMLSKSA